MKAAVIRKYGKPEVFQIEDMPEPAPKPKQVKVEIIASSVNPVDWKIRSGALAVLTGWKFPRILGGDFSGKVVECGSEVNDIRVGDEVFGLSNAMSIGRAYAEFITCDADKLAIKPNKLNFLESAGIPLAGSTAYQALHHMCEIKPGMRVLIIGATGGVGHFAVQIAKAENCQVTGVCHSRNAELAKQIGCDEVLAYDKADITKSKDKYDILFDAAAKYGYLSCRSLLTSQGTYVCTIPTPLLMVMHGFSYIFPWKRGRFVGVNSNRKDLDQLARLANEDQLRPFIENIFPLEKIAEAHALSETEKARGKIAIRISDEI